MPDGLRVSLPPPPTSVCSPLSTFGLFLLERHLARVAWSLTVLNLICIPQSTHALDQGGVEPRQAVSPRPEAKDDTASLQRRLPLSTFGLPPCGRTLERYSFHHTECTLGPRNVFIQCGLRRFPHEEFW